jgi:thiol-disulfide isomerase/thioredoxin
MTDEIFYEANKTLLNDLFTKRDELDLGKININVIWTQEFGSKTFEQYNIIINGSVTPTHKKNLEIFRTYIKSLDNKTIEEYVDCSDGADSFVLQVDNCLDIHTNELKTFTVEKGEVTLIRVWATWSGHCQDIMSHNQEMLENCPEWSGKVRIVGLSVDESLEELKKMIEEKKWDKVEHYQLQNGWEHPLIKEYGIDGIPTIILVDKEGDVVFYGHSPDIYPEKAINKLINGQSISDVEEDVVLESTMITFKEKDEVCEALTNIFEENKAIQPNNKYLLTISLMKTVTKENLNDDLFEGTVFFWVVKSQIHQIM